MADKHRRVAIYRSFAAENRAEDERRSRASTQERLAEFASLLARVKGPSWTTTPIARTATVERVDWHDASIKSPHSIPGNPSFSDGKE